MGEEPMNSSLPDAQLIKQAQAGEVNAFGELYRRYLTQIYRYIRSRVSTDRDAEDLAEAVFLNAFQGLKMYRERGAPFGAYLYRVARNLIVDHYRGSRRSEPLDEQGGQLTSGENAERVVVQSESLREIREALLRLPEAYQEVIRLRVLLEMSTGEVGRWMGKNTSNVRVLLHRALKALRKELDQGDE
jgi:RNA polymerase sigma-70 factor (ECF subfamily)